MKSPPRRNPTTPPPWAAVAHEQRDPDPDERDEKSDDRPGVHLHGVSDAVDEHAARSVLEHVVDGLAEDGGLRSRSGSDAASRAR